MAYQREAATDNPPETKERTKKSWLELDEEFRSTIDNLPETNKRTKRSWVEVLDEESKGINFVRMQDMVHRRTP